MMRCVLEFFDNSIRQRFAGFEDLVFMYVILCTDNPLNIASASSKFLLSEGMMIERVPFALRSRFE